jgi:putative Ca2+/H+ antiporter (TMEM165/GDT1 family)
MDGQALLAALGLTLIAELGDKTQLAVVTQTCKYRRPWPVFLGASLALTLVTLIGAVGGGLLGQWIPAGVLRAAAALAFVLMGVLIAREAFQAGRNPDSCELDAGSACSPAGRGWDWKAFGSTLGLLFVAELGDKTQLAVLSLSGQSGAPAAVFLGGALALILVTAAGVAGGQGLCRLVPQRTLLWVSAAAFVVMGALMGVGIL